MRKAIFLDKDGTLIDNVPYNVNPNLIRLREGVIEALSTLQKKGFLLIVISNQSGIARGRFKESALINVQYQLQALLRKGGVYLDGFIYCPHHPEGSVKKYAIACHCRKPMPGMIVSAAKKMNIHLTSSWMIGDSFHDVVAGSRATCRTILIHQHLSARNPFTGNRSAAAQHMMVSHIKTIPDLVLAN